jgi:ferrous iron transport protein B
MKTLKIPLIGQPNVGKSSLLNALVGSKVTVSNYPGTTVEITKAKKSFDKTVIEFIDTPGIYSISDRSEEEKVTEKALFEEEVDGAIVIVDATSLERSLYMALQILEAQIPAALALNFVEEAERKGIHIDCEKLKIILNIPVVPINPLTKKGMDELVDVASNIRKTSKKPFTIRYDDHIEQAITKISSQIKESALPTRFVALRVLEGDEHFYKYLTNMRHLEDAKESLKEHPKVAEDIAITKYGTASFIAEKATQIASLKNDKNIESGFDRVLLHRLWGPLTTGLFLLTVFGILLYFGNLLQDLLMGLTENLVSSLGVAEHSIISLVFVNGLTGVAAGVSIALPYVFLFYLILGVLEDIGLLSRFVVNAEFLLKKLGFPGKAFIPLALGLGCTVPAIRATRVLSSIKEQFHTASLFAFVPCSSRIAIIMGIVGYYGSIQLAFAVLATSLAAGLIWAFGIKKVVHIQSEPLLIELPPYRTPQLGNVLAKSWIRMKDFVYVVIPLLALGGIAYGILDILDLTNLIAAPLAPIATWLGLPPATIIPILFGFLQKDLTSAMLLSVVGNEVSSALTPLQIYTFSVAGTIGLPCIIAWVMLIKEFGYKRATALTLTSIFYGLLIAGFAWRIASIL